MQKHLYVLFVDVWYSIIKRRIFGKYFWNLENSYWVCYKFFISFGTLVRMKVTWYTMILVKLSYITYSSLSFPKICSTNSKTWIFFTKEMNFLRFRIQESNYLLRVPVYFIHTNNHKEELYSKLIDINR